VTPAMASLNAITFAFWCSKPLSVQEPVNVYVTEPSGLARGNISQNSKNTVGPVEYDIEDTVRDIFATTFFMAMLKPASYSHPEGNFASLGWFLFRLLFTLLYAPAYPVCFFRFRDVVSSLDHRNGESRKGFGR